MKRSTFPSSKTDKSRYMKNQSFSVKWRVTSPVLGARLLHELRKELKVCHNSATTMKLSRHPSEIRVSYKESTLQSMHGWVGRIENFEWSDGVAWKCRPHDMVIYASGIWMIWFQRSTEHVTSCLLEKKIVQVVPINYKWWNRDEKCIMVVTNFIPSVLLDYVSFLRNVIGKFLL
jgi:hypothetical protein